VVAEERERAVALEAAAQLGEGALGAQAVELAAAFLGEKQQSRSPLGGAQKSSMTCW
jgi:hypothetical protein